MRSIESLNSSEEVSTSSITGSLTGYWNLLAAPDELPTMFSHPYREAVRAHCQQEPSKILNWNYCIEDRAHKCDGTSEELQKQEATFDSLSYGYKGNEKSGKKLQVESSIKKTIASTECC